VEGLSLNQLEGGKLRLVCSASLARGAGSDEEEYFTTAVECTARDRREWDGEEGAHRANSLEGLLSVRRSMLISDVLPTAASGAGEVGGFGFVSDDAGVEGM